MSGPGNRQSRTKKLHGPHATAILIPILWLATWLRFHHLALQSFWNDEGNTARLVERPLRLILEGAAGDIHPPGYYLLLHYWRALVGASEFALRSYSALCGILTVAVVAAVVRLMASRSRTEHRALISPWLMVIPALLVAVHPLAVYYSQEARMYAQLSLVSALTLWLSLRMAQARTVDGRLDGRIPLGLALCIAAGLYTQYTYALALAGLDTALALDWLLRPPRHRSPVGVWLLAHGLAGVLFAPWAPIARRALGWAPPDLSARGALHAMSKTLLIGITYPDSLPIWAWSAAALLLLGALWASLRAPVGSTRRLALWGALGMALFPPALIAAAGIYRPAYLKFLMMALPGLAVALGTVSWPSKTLERPSHAMPTGQLLALPLLTALLVVQARALYHLYTDPTYARDDYRGLAAHIREEGRPGDAILLNAPNQWEVFTYYYPTNPNALPVYPAPYRPSQEEAEIWVADIVTRHQGGRLFVLFWGDREADPQGWIEKALATQAFKAGERWVTTIRLAYYGTGSQVKEPDVTMGLQFGEGIHLQGYHLPERAWHPGDIVPLTLFWRVNQVPDERLKVFIHLINPEGTLVAQVDMEPQAGTYPTPLWKPGSTIPDRYGIPLPPTLSPGVYTLKMGLYRLTGERLPILTADGTPLGDAVVLRQIQVTTTP